MNPFELTPEKIAAEVFEFNQKLAGGFETLRQIQDVSTGVSDREAIYEEDKLVLYRYKSRTEKQHTVPVLIVYALVNRPYMADLQEDRSLIRGALDAGLDIYLVDWGYPDSADRFLTLDDYINGYLDRCVDVVRKQARVDRINLLGICQGGTFSLCYTSLHQDKVRNLITTVTPVDFHTSHDLLSQLVRHIDIDNTVAALGNIPGEVLNWAFLTLKPFRLMGQKYIDLVEVLSDPEKTVNFLRMEKWIFDSPAQAGEAYRQFIRYCYQENQLIKAGIKLGDKTVNLENITLPILNIYARDDHLVPPDSSKALAGCVSSSDYTELEFPGGHIGIYVSARAREMLPQAIADWLSKRSV
jgi:polyhydroxyalkanoate synthase